MASASPSGHEGTPSRRGKGGIGWVRFDHVAIAAEDPGRAATFWQKLFGLELDHWTLSQDEGFRVAQFHFPKRQMGLEIIGPWDESSFMKRFLDTRGPGMHHITIEVEDAEQAYRYVREELEIEPISEPFSDFEWSQFFIHPRDTGGVLIQLYSWLPGRRPADWPE